MTQSTSQTFPRSSPVSELTKQASVIDTGPPELPASERMDGVLGPENAEKQGENDLDGAGVPPPDPRSDAQIRAEADREAEITQRMLAQLKAIYDDVLNQPVPERFLKLLNNLESEGST